MARRRHRAAFSQDGPGGEAHVASDEEICRRLESGNTGAAEVVYERVATVVDAVLFRLLGPNDHEREDLAQQAMERIIGTIVSGRYMRDCSLSSWATLITQHLAIDTMRSRTRDRRVFDRHVGTQTVELVPDGNRSTEQIVETQRRANRLIRVLSSISSTHAEAVVLHDLLGHDLAEIARLTGVSVAAAQSRLVRGRRKALRLLTVAERRARKS
ncbi:MAG TPA: RNA polymerase sigma factor [Polyangia bacterium]|nr:RNA polymerase sigma factor [Polyangia bacterium]